MFTREWVAVIGIELAIIGAPLYLGLHWKLAIALHAALIVLWALNHLVFGNWDNIDFGVALFIIAIMLAVLLPAYFKMRAHKAKMSQDQQFSPPTLTIPYRGP